MTELRRLKLEGVVSDVNSTSIPLGIGGAFPGAWVEILDYGIIFINVYSDVASATDGLVIQQSSDGSNVDHDDKYTVPAGTGKNYSINPYARYMRATYTNGVVAQTEFRLQTILKGNAKPSSHRIQDSISDDDDAELVKAVLTGKANGSFVLVKTTPDGDLKISDNSNGLSIAEGNVTGKSFVHKFGKAPDFDNSDGEVTLWDGAEDGTAWELMSYIYSSTADIDSISSSNVGDNQEIVVEGLDINWEFVSQTVTLNGQTRVALSTSLIRCFRAYNNDSSVFAGHVFVFVNVALAGGVPTVPADIRAIIHPEAQQTLMTVYTVPVGKEGYIRDWYASTAGANRSSNYPIQLKIRLFGKVFRTRHYTALSDDGTSAYQHKYEEPEGPLPEKTDIEMTCEMLVAGGTAAAISGGFDLVLKDT